MARLRVGMCVCVCMCERGCVFVCWQVCHMYLCTHAGCVHASVCVCDCTLFMCVGICVGRVLKLTVSRQPEDIFMSSLSVDTNQRILTWCTPSTLSCTTHQRPHFTFSFFSSEVIQLKHWGMEESGRSEGTTCLYKSAWFWGTQNVYFYFCLLPSDVYQTKLPLLR